MADNLLGVFGMCEMEVMVQKLLDTAKERGSKLSQTRIYTDGLTPLQVAGLVHLACNGFITPSYPNSSFCITKSLIDHLRKYECFKDLEYVPYRSNGLPLSLDKRVELTKDIHSHTSPLKEHND